MSEEKTPEQLLSEALRAKAVQAPIHAPPPLPDAEQAASATGQEKPPDADKGPAAKPEKPPASTELAAPEKPADIAETESAAATDEIPPSTGERSTQDGESEPSAPAASQEEAKHKSLFADNDASFELLSGHDYHLPAMSAPTTPTPATARARVSIAPPLGAGWILLLAVVLGAAAGALAGLLTLR